MSQRILHGMNRSPNEARAWLVIFFAGAILGTALDHLHVMGGVTSYAHPFLFSQAVWVPALFGFAACGFALLHRWLRWLFRGAPSVSPRGLGRDFALFAGAYAVSAFVRLPNTALLGIFVGVYAARAIAVREQPHRIAHAIACALIGIGAESFLTGAGLFVHHSADFVGVPRWLPGLYLLAAPLLAQIDDLAVSPSARPGSAAP